MPPLSQIEFVYVFEFILEYLFSFTVLSNLTYLPQQFIYRHVSREQSVTVKACDMITEYLCFNTWRGSFPLVFLS